ncbi:nucleotidyltransferase domain-containing protein [Candidatus Poribacteria bacterium]|nr:nucleotidyltransferase domain-containing protein [Candidatus Poribacteria bacterium]
MDKLLEMAHQDDDVLAVLLFGSVARGEQTPLSDIDICLVLIPQNKPYRSIDLSHKRLEYLKEFDMDIHVFQQLPIYIRRRVLREGKVLFVRDEDTLYDLATRTAKAFEDFKHIYYDYLEEVANDGKRTHLS